MRSMTVSTPQGDATLNRELASAPGTEAVSR